MKCNECKYHDEKDVCHAGACGNGKNCCDQRNRDSNDDNDTTCVWNCDFCAKYKELKETTK